MLKANEHTLLTMVAMKCVIWWWCFKNCSCDFKMTKNHFIHHQKEINLLIFMTWEYGTDYKKDAP